MKNLCITLTLTATLLLNACKSSAAASSPTAPNVQEAKLIAVLKSDAPQKEKADACRELAHVGSKISIPVLASLLGDEKLSHMARYGLETNPDPSVDRALCDALPSLQGRQLAGVITSLGVRRDANAVKPISRFLQNTDPDVASAAARALGAISTKSAVRALEAALPISSGVQQLAVCEGLFRSAEACSKKGDQKEAIRIYDRLRSLSGTAHQVRAGALRGAILVRGNGGLALLIEALRGNDWVLADAAARAAMEMSGAAVTKALVGELPGLPGDRKILVLQVIGKRADAGALPAVLAVARSGDKATRLAAIQTIAEMGDASGAQPLAELTRDADREVAAAARNSLASLPGRKVDDIVLAMLSNSDSATKLAGLELVAMRRMVSAVPVLQKATTDADAKVRASALKQLAEFGGEAELPGLLVKLQGTTNEAELAALESALSTLCARIGKPDASADRLIACMAQAKPAQKAALLRVLGSVGGMKALTAVCAAVGSGEQAERAAALDTLADWPSADAAPELLKFARSLNASDEKLQCLRGYLRWAADADVPAKQRLTMCKDAAELVQRVEEKKLLLAALGAINSPEAVAQILPFVDDNSAREEACVAVVNIAERMAKSRNATKLAPRVITGLEKVAQTTSNGDLAKRSKTLVDANK